MSDSQKLRIKEMEQLFFQKLEIQLKDVYKPALHSSYLKVMQNITECY